MNHQPRRLAGAFALALLAAPAAHASVLQASPDAPVWAHVGAAALLWLHIGGGAAGIATGAIAIASRKGGKIHRAVGRVFFWVMLVCYVVATCVAPFLDDGQRPNTIAGVMALVPATDRVVGGAAARDQGRRAPGCRAGRGAGHCGRGGALHEDGFGEPDGHDRWLAARSVHHLHGSGAACGGRRASRASAANIVRIPAHRAAPVADVFLAVHRIGLVLPRPDADRAGMAAGVGGSLSCWRWRRWRRCWSGWCSCRLPKRRKVVSRRSNVRRASGGAEKRRRRPCFRSAGATPWSSTRFVLRTCPASRPVALIRGRPYDAFRRS